jgi:hypothetical protein
MKQSVVAISIAVILLVARVQTDDYYPFPLSIRGSISLEVSRSDSGKKTSFLVIIK